MLDKRRHLRALNGVQMQKRNAEKSAGWPNKLLRQRLLICGGNPCALRASSAPQSLIAGSLVRLRAGLDSTELLSVELRFAFTTPTMRLAR